MFERFTKSARRAVVAGVEAAAELGADKAGPEHLLLALAELEELEEEAGALLLTGYGVTAEGLRQAVTGATRRAGLTEEEVAALRSVGIDADEVFRRIEEAFGPDALADAARPTPRRLSRLGSPFGRDAKKVLELALREAIALGHRHIGHEHILLGVLRTGVRGPVGDVLARHGVTYEDVRQRTIAGSAGAA